VFKCGSYVVALGPVGVEQCAVSGGRALWHVWLRHKQIYCKWDHLSAGEREDVDKGMEDMSEGAAGAETSVSFSTSIPELRDNIDSIW